MTRTIRHLTSLGFLFALVMAAPAVVVAQTCTGLALTASDAETVCIERDDFGVPEISAPTEAAVFFGQGFAVAQDRLFQLETFRRAALGRLAELDPSQYDTDVAIRTVFYTEAERQAQYDALPAPVQTMFDAYVAGINTYLDSMAVDPQQYKPVQFTQVPDPEPWAVTDAVAVVQFFMRRFGQYGGEELVRAGELMQQGQAWFAENRPINDPSAPTTIGEAGGTPALRIQAEVRRDVSPTVVREHVATQARVAQDLERLGIPTLGSFAVVTAGDRSASGNAMLLGAPQMNGSSEPQADETSVVNEVELITPALYVAGMTVAGAPGVIIGRNRDVAWTLTSGNSDNTDTFRETVQLQDGQPVAYQFEGDFVPFEVREETINQGAEATTVPVLRTAHGPVIRLDLENEQVFTHQMTFWGQELEMAAAFYDVWNATDLASFEAAIADSPMNFNIFYAGRDQHVAYFHTGKLLRSIQTLDGPDPRLPRNGDGSQEWGEDPFLPFEDLPSVVDPDDGYLVNWNNKPAPDWNNGDNVPWADVPDRRSRTFRVEAIDDFVGPLSAVAFEDLLGVFGVVRDFGSYPGTYQQVVEMTPDYVDGSSLVPPGQSGFVDLSGTPSPHVADQWSFYQEGTLKPFGTTVDREAPGVPGRFALQQNYPNPFNPATTIRYSLDATGPVELAVFDVLGRRVATLVDGPRAAGTHTVTFDGDGLASGLYLYRLVTGGQEQTRLMHLVK
ncbi:MAG: T9SS type A sorting domain-containing protein [Bacteroidetes bacterium]|jgi:penicillin amidase|nr:T9SS type A sorting domain-containing protein [Bacteroidota bacterium]